MPNNAVMLLTAPEIIVLLGGLNAASRFFGVKPPSVSGWLESESIPEGRLIKKAAELEQAIPDGKFSRREQWPYEYRSIWPELDGPPIKPEQATAMTAKEPPLVEVVRSDGAVDKFPDRRRANHPPVEVAGLTLVDRRAQAS